MFKSWYAKKECHDLRTVDVRLEAIRMVNFNTAISLKLHIMNRGFTPLEVQGIKANLWVGELRVEVPYVPEKLYLEAEDIGGKRITVLIPAPFLSTSSFIDAAKWHDDGSLDIQVSDIALSIARNKTSNTLRWDKLGDPEWIKSINGIERYVAA